MRKIALFLALMMSTIMMAQSAYITHHAEPEKDYISDINGDYGVVILSKRSDLVISVTNVTSDSQYSVNPVGKKQDGLYGYEIRVNKKESKSIKVEVSKRGDVYKTNFVIAGKADLFQAYVIDEVQHPIRMEDQTQQTSSVLNDELAALEFTTSIPDLKIEYSEKLGAEIKTTNKTGDKSIFVTTLTIPVKNIAAAKQRVTDAQKAHEEWEKRMDATTNAPDADWVKLDKLQEEMEEAQKDFAAFVSVFVSGQGTNKLQVDADMISNLKPRQKLCYGVLLLKIEVPVNEFSAKVAEGGRLYALRDYEGARRSFISASKLAEAPADLLPTVKSNIAYCDSCIKYERLTIAALRRINELKKNDNIAQTDILKYYGAAADFMRIAGKYNPCDYYTKNVKTLETFIENMPLAMKFTIVKWMVTRTSAEENGSFSNVELWAYYGAENPRLNDFASDRKFRRMVSKETNLYKQMGTSDGQGIVDIEINRKALPTGIFFRPVDKDIKTTIVYKNMMDIMAQSVGEYNKRQFRMKMYIRK